MKFKLESAYYKPLNLDYWKDLYDEIINVTIEDNELYVEVNNISELWNLVNEIPEDLYENTSGHKPSEVIIDFKRKIITIYDYYK